MSGLTLNVLVLGATSLLTDISSEMVFTLLPFFMVNVLSIEMAFVGLIEGAAEATSSLLKVFSGWFSDKTRKRKPLVVLGYSLSAFVKPLFALAASVSQVFMIRVLDRIGKGVRTSPRDALIADSIQPDVRGKAYGLHRSMDTIGAVLGPLLAFLLFPIIWYRGVFLVSIIPGLAAVVLLTLLMKEKKREGVVWKGSSFLSDFRSLPRDFKVYVAMVAIFTLGNFSYAFFLLRAGELGVPIMFVPLLYLLFNLVYAISALPIGTLADRIGKKPVILFGYAMFGVTCLGFAFAYSSFHAVILFVAYGVFFAIADTLQRAIVPDLVTAELRGTAFGVLHTTIGVAAFPSSLIAGVLWQIYGATIPFMLAAAVSIASTVLFLLFMPGKKNQSQLIS
ncbi:MAG: MFS transporter [Candidatus Bathyarchaeota archaeon]|nr:MFS transporter [Candidatus Bathyarchaeota archaeon]